MAVKFECVLDDTDASNLISILSDARVAALATAEQYRTAIATSGGWNRAAYANAEWYEGHAEYLDRLKQNVLNSMHKSSN